MKIINWVKDPERELEARRASHRLPHQFPKRRTAYTTPLDAMATHKPIAVPRHDVRSEAVEANRDINSKTKWNKLTLNNATLGPYRDVNGKARPRKGFSKTCKDGFRHRNEKPLNHQAHLRKMDNSGGDVSGFSGKIMARKQRVLESEKENEDRYEGPAPELGSGEVVFSYTCAGPSRGDNVLGAALDKAVAKYEDRKIRELVEHEYDVLEAASDVGALETPVHELGEDDFEFV